MQGKNILLKDMLLIRGKWNYIFHNLRMKQHFPQFREKEALANYAQISENFGINFDFHPGFPEWLAFRKFDNFRIFRKLSVCSALVSKVPQCLVEMKAPTISQETIPKLRRELERVSNLTNH